MTGAAGRDAVAALCERHADLPRRIARRMAATMPAHVDSEELEPAAWDGLYRAAVTWNPDEGRPFTGWAWLKIVGAIRDDLRAWDTQSRYARATERNVRHASDLLSAELRREPTDEELSAALGMPVERLQAHRISTHRARTPASLDARIEDGMQFAAPIADHDPDPETIAWVRAAVACLPDKLAGVVGAIFWNETRYEDIAADLHVTASRVSQMRREAVDMISDAVRWGMWGEAGEPLPPRRSARRQRYRSAVATAHAEARARQTQRGLRMA